jgi:predicted aminopeptidase
MLVIRGAQAERKSKHRNNNLKAVATKKRTRLVAICFTPVIDKQSQSHKRAGLPRSREEMQAIPPCPRLA